MSEPLWTFTEVLAATGGRARRPGADEITSVSIDSRTLRPGALFLAIRGESRDGHAFVADAFAKGAAAAIAEQGFDAADGPLIHVPDTFIALTALGRAARARSTARVIAVTGSAGKTGNKEALRLALAPSGATHASRASYNNHWGVPLSLAECPRTARFGVFEAGMNHPGEITPLAMLIRPHVAIVTTVAPVHLGFFDSVDQIAEAKAEIFSGLEPDGVAILNRDNPYFDLLRARAEAAGAGAILGFGRHEDSAARLLELKPHADGSDVTADIGGIRLDFRMGAPGEHLALNALAVLAAVKAVGGDLKGAASALGAYRAQKGRGARTVIKLPGGAVNLIDESYNANPASMRAALAALAQTPRTAFPRRVAVLGDMLELGGAGPELHRGLAEAVDAAGIDVVFACGPLMAGLYEALPEGARGAYAATSAELEPSLLAAIGPGDVVMVKGSLGSHMGPLVQALQAHLAGTSDGQDSKA